MLLRQLFDPDTSSYSYLLADPQTREAILIDPVRTQADRDIQLISELGLRLLATVETHVHADHITGAWRLKMALSSRIIYPAAAGVEGADRLVGEGEVIRFGRFAVEVRATPGHTAGCTTYITTDRAAAFTGDALLIRGAGRTDFQEGDAATLYRSVHDQILSLPEDTAIYPAHDYKGHTVSSVGEELAHNPRLGEGKSESDFVQIMDNLNLSYPRHIDKALPANQKLGRLAGDSDAVVEAAGPLLAVPRSPSGVRHVRPAWVAEHGDAVRLVDVRQPHELVGELPKLPSAEAVPLAALEGVARTWDTCEPVVLICRSSGRSDRAALLLESMGFSQVASMVGGMLAWRS